jgi:DNA polymerase-3 subunit chi
VTQIDFYVLKEGSRDNRYSLACRVVEKAFQQQQRVLLWTGSQEESRHMDRLLWTYRQDSFIPHGLLHQADAGVTPILIGHQEDAGDEHGVLINLTQQIPPFFSRFERLIESLDRTPEVLGPGRERYRYYKDRGYDIGYHEIG